MLHFMTDAFTQIIAQQVAQILTQSSQPFQSIETDTESSGFNVTPQQVLAAMQGNSQWLKQFEQEVEQSFKRAADNSLRYWREHTDKEMRDSIKDLAQITQIILKERQQVGQAGVGSSRSGNNANSVRNLPNLVVSLTARLLGNLTESRSINQSETARSKQISGQYKASRGQIQAEMAKELSRGQRYT